MPMSSDEVAERVLEEIQRLFSEVELTPEEKAFIQDAGRRLANEAFEGFLAAKNREGMRPFVIAMAIAATLGPSQVWDDGIDVLKRPVRKTG